MDIDALKKIGLTEGELKVYLALLKLGSCTTGPIVDESHVARSKIYHILERLIEKGLATYIIKSKTKYFQAVEPKKIMNYVDKLEKDLHENRKKVQEILPQLELFQQMAVPEEAQIYKGLEGIKSARELALKTLKKGDTFYCLGANKINQQPLQAYWRDFHKRRKAKGIKAKYIVQEDSRDYIGKEKEMSGLIDVKYLDIAGPVHIDIFGDYVVTCIMMGTYTSFLLKNRFAADYYREYFDKAWEKARK